MTARPRAVDWPGFVNARSLGGLPVAGGVVAAGALYRSDRPGLYADAAGTAEALERAGVRTVVNLRNGSEGDDVDVLARHANRLNLPLTDPAGRDVVSEGRTQGERYLDLLRGSGASIVRAITAIADAPAGGVLVHCTAGKDRTGLVVALVLLLLGADEATVADDYVLSRDNLAPFHEGWLATLTDEARAIFASTDTNAPREAIEAVLAWLRAQGGAATWLRAQGLRDETVTRLRERLVA